MQSLYNFFVGNKSQSVYINSQKILRTKLGAILSVLSLGTFILFFVLYFYEFQMTSPDRISTFKSPAATLKTPPLKFYVYYPSIYVNLSLAIWVFDDNRAIYTTVPKQINFSSCYDSDF